MSDQMKDQPAFAAAMASEQGHQMQEGLTKREYYAGQALAGWLSTQDPNVYANPKDVAEICVDFSDALIARLEQSDG